LITATIWSWSDRAAPAAAARDVAGADVADGRMAGTLAALSAADVARAAVTVFVDWVAADEPQAATNMATKMSDAIGAAIRRPSLRVSDFMGTSCGRLPVI
jgi:hypothetical protein